MFKALEMMKKNDQKGFTLIELLIVIAIIAILAAIAIPQYAQYRQKAVAANAVSALQICASEAAAAYANNSAAPGQVCQGIPSITLGVDPTNGSITGLTAAVNVPLASGGNATCSYANGTYACN